MKILFLPIDVEVPTFNLNFHSNEIRTGKYNQKYWNTTSIINEYKSIPELMFVLDQLPFIDITTIYFKKQQVKALPHIDVVSDMVLKKNEYQHYLENEPIGYRIVLQGSVDKISVKRNGVFEKTTLPKVPSCYVINSTSAWHTVEDDIDRRIIYIRGFVDKDKHQKLIEKSLSSYKNFALIENPL